MHLEWEPEDQPDPNDVETALAEVHKTGDRRKIKRRSAVTGGAAILAVIAVIVASSLSASPSRPVAAPPQPSSSLPASSIPQLTLAAHVIKTAQDSLTNLHSISAIESDTYDPTDFTYWAASVGVFTQSYRWTADGSYWSRWTWATPRDNQNKATSTTTEDSYTAPTGVSASCFYGDTSPGASARVPLCGNALKPSLLQTDLSAFTEAVNQAAQSQPSAEESTSGGNKTWTLQFDQHGSSPTMSSTKVQDFTLHTTITVDQAIGLPIALDTTINGKPLQHSALTGVQVNPNLTVGQLQVVYPKNASVSDDSRAGITFGTSISGPEMNVLPVNAIPGFDTKEVWTENHQYLGNGLAQLGMAGLAACSNDGQPGKPNFAQQISRSGPLAFWSQVIDLTTCPNPPSDTDIAQPSGEMGPSPVAAQTIKTFTATSGALAGTKFTIYQTAPQTYLLTGRNSKVLVIAAGDLTVDQATQIANGYTLG